MGKRLTSPISPRFFFSPHPYTTDRGPIRSRQRRWFVFVPLFLLSPPFLPLAINSTRGGGGGSESLLSLRHRQKPFLPHSLVFSLSLLSPFAPLLRHMGGFSPIPSPPPSPCIVGRENFTSFSACLPSRQCTTTAPQFGQIPTLLWLSLRYSSELQFHHPPSLRRS